MSTQITAVTIAADGSIESVTTAEGAKIPTKDVIARINGGAQSFHTNVNGNRAEVLNKSTYLVTSPDQTEKNNLGELRR